MLKTNSPEQPTLKNSFHYLAMISGLDISRQSSEVIVHLHGHFAGSKVQYSVGPLMSDERL